MTLPSMLQRRTLVRCYARLALSASVKKDRKVPQSAARVGVAGFFPRSRVWLWQSAHQRRVSDRRPGGRFFLEARGRASDINGWILLVDRPLVSLSLGLVLKKRVLHGTRKQRVPQPEWVTDMKSLLIICAVALLVQSSPVWSQEALPPLKKQSTEEAVLAEHLDALNHCDWNGSSRNIRTISR